LGVRTIVTELERALAAAIFAGTTASRISNSAIPHSFLNVETEVVELFRVFIIFGLLICERAK
jgi:hypothetical protein